MLRAGLMARLRISEIFYSLQGESRTSGLSTLFIRLTGCPLRCSYCDTEYAFSGGEWMELAAVLDQVERSAARRICVTGGEPLAQTACIELLDSLLEQGCEVSLETSGALDISAVDPRVSRVVDLKTPGSGEETRNRYANLNQLTANDQLKFVICDRADYDWSCSMLEQYGLIGRCELLFSPAFGRQDPAQLAEWILADRLDVRFQLQLHKQLWGEEAGR